ncbi:MAG: nuclear transport factor 2 family protein [Ginsengibacter sp.]
METATLTKNNVQIIQQAFDDFGKGNIQGILDVCTNDVVWSSAENPNVPIAGTFKGKDGVSKFFSAIAENVVYLRFEPREFFNDKDAVIVLGHHTGTVKKTGKTYDHEWCMIFKLRDGKIYNYYVFVDTRDQAESFK